MTKKLKKLSKTQKLNIKYLTEFIKNHSYNFEGCLDANSVIKDILNNPKS